MPVLTILAIIVLVAFSLVNGSGGDDLSIEPVGGDQAQQAALLKSTDFLDDTASTGSKGEDDYPKTTDLPPLTNP